MSLFVLMKAFEDIVVPKMIWIKSCFDHSQIDFWILLDASTEAFLLIV